MVAVVTWVVLIVFALRADWSALDISNFKTSYLVVMVMLVPLNWLVEARRWQVLAAENKLRMSLGESLKSVLAGYAGRVLSPMGIGEYAARAMPLKSAGMGECTALMVVGGMAQTVVIAIGGACALAFAWGGQIEMEVKLRWGMVVLTVGLLFIYYLLPVVFRRFARWKYVRVIGCVGKVAMTRVLLIGALRYVVMCAQMMCAVVALSTTDMVVDNLLFGIAVYYLFVTFTPSIGLGDLAARGLWGGLLGGVPWGAAAMLTWMFNQAMAALIGAIFIMRNS